MPKPQKARKPGRPKSVNPRDKMISFRVTEAVWLATERYRDSLGVAHLSVAHAARDFYEKQMERAGLLNRPEKKGGSK